MRYGAKKRLTDTTENVLKRPITDNPGDLCWGQGTVDAEEVCGETSNVRGSHGSSRDNIGPPIIPSGNDVHAGSPDINRGAPIGEIGLDVGDSRSADCKGLQNARGRIFARVLVVVPCGYGDGNTVVVKLKAESLVSGVAVTFYLLGAYRHNSLVEGFRSTATQAHRSNRGYAGTPCLLGDPIDAGNTVFW